MFESDHPECLPLALTESDPENYAPNTPVQAHGPGNAHDTHVLPDAENHGQDQPYPNGCKQGNKSGEDHIPGCPQAFAQGVGEGKRQGIENVVSSTSRIPRDLVCGSRA